MLTIWKFEVSTHWVGGVISMPAGAVLLHVNVQIGKPYIWAMVDHLVKPSETLMVGDWDEDMQAAIRAGCRFTWADAFFGRFPF